MDPMECFYVGLLGFQVADRSNHRGAGEMVCLIQDAIEHHQLVLRQGDKGSSDPPLLDHIAFRIDSLSELRAVHDDARSAGIEPIETVSHGSTWSVYVRDPENNRIEFFVDTPWPVAQPCRFDIDLSMADAELRTRTEDHLRELSLI
jgi:catechol-2,3-dioxygenase